MPAALCFRVERSGPAMPLPWAVVATVEGVEPLQAIVVAHHASVSAAMADAVERERREYPPALGGAAGA